MSTNLYLRLNNLFPNDQLITEVKTYKLKNLFPERVDTDNKRAAYDKKYKDFSLSADQRNLIYNPSNLQVVPRINITTVLKKEYKTKFGAGIVAFYKTIREKYLNIKRSDVSAFIKRQPIPQMTSIFKHRTNKPIISKFPNQLWAVDLIELQYYKSKNRNYTYIFNAVDIFSRKCFLSPCKTKTAEECKTAFQSIVQRADVKPNYIICDNGGEFKAQFAEYCEANDIKIRLNRAYSPQANGVVERCNMEIRKLMRNIFLQNEDNNWIDNLQQIENIRNATYTTAINNIPDKIWNNSKAPITERNIPIHYKTDNDKTRQLLASQTVLKNVKKQIEEYKDEELEVGDRVRIRMDALSNNIKKLVKAGNTKQIVVVYSPVVFKILRKITPKNGLLERSRYVCGTTDGTRMLVNKETGTQPRQFYANSLLKVNSDEDNYDISMKEAIELSGVTITKNDVFSAPYNG